MDLKCEKCGKLLGKKCSSIEMEIQCPRCGHKKTYVVVPAFNFEPRRSNG